MQSNEEALRAFLKGDKKWFVDLSIPIVNLPRVTLLTFIQYHNALYLHVHV